MIYEVPQHMKPAYSFMYIFSHWALDSYKLDAAAARVSKNKNGILLSYAYKLLK